MLKTTFIPEYQPERPTLSYAVVSAAVRGSGPRGGPGWAFKSSLSQVKTDVQTLLSSDRRVNKARLGTQELLENLELG